MRSLLFVPGSSARMMAKASSSGADVVIYDLEDAVHPDQKEAARPLVKTALARMFALRNLPVLSWVGHNILGNRDGLVLSDPTNRASKLRSKDQAVARILGYAPQSLTTIEYVESLDDWKTAWDHVHFQGFLGVRMALQFIWQGCDSALAAPLVIDLARLALLAKRRGETGVLRHLACFFKSPLGVDEHDLGRQFGLLENYVRACTPGGSGG